MHAQIHFHTTHSTHSYTPPLHAVYNITLPNYKLYTLLHSILYTYLHFHTRLCTCSCTNTIPIVQTVTLPHYKMYTQLHSHLYTVHIVTLPTYTLFTQLHFPSVNCKHSYISLLHTVHKINLSYSILYRQNLSTTYYCTYTVLQTPVI